MKDLDLHVGDLLILGNASQSVALVIDRKVEAGEDMVYLTWCPTNAGNHKARFESIVRLMHYGTLKHISGK